MTSPLIANGTMFNGWQQGNAMDSMMNWGNQSSASLPLNASQIAAPAIDMGVLQSLPSMGVANTAPGFMDKMLGYRGPDGTQFNGWGGMALGAASGLMNGFVGMQQMGLFKDQLAQGKRQFDINFGAQQKLTNSRLEDRQRARVAANPSAYQSVGDYMNTNRI
jgi:hypothetical protein